MAERSVTSEGSRSLASLGLLSRPVIMVARGSGPTAVPILCVFVRFRPRKPVPETHFHQIGPRGQPIATIHGYFIVIYTHASAFLTVAGLIANPRLIGDPDVVALRKPV
ncbi:MAG: hypothetical protein AAGG65_19060 [Pseudomonadota bacterium]